MIRLKLYHRNKKLFKDDFNKQFNTNFINDDIQPMDYDEGDEIYIIYNNVKYIHIELFEHSLESKLKLFGLDSIDINLEIEGLFYKCKIPGKIFSEDMLIKDIFYKTKEYRLGIDCDFYIKDNCIYNEELLDELLIPFHKESEYLTKEFKIADKGLYFSYDSTINMYPYDPLSQKEVNEIKDYVNKIYNKKINIKKIPVMWEMNNIFDIKGLL